MFKFIKNSIFQIFLIINSCFLLLSCIKDIEIAIPENKSRLVVYSAIAPVNIPYIKSFHFDIQSSLHIFDTAKTGFIRNAEVLYYKNGILIDTFLYSDEENLYISKASDSLHPFSKYPLPGDTCMMIISSPGHESIFAKTSIPGKVDIINSSITPVAFIDRGFAISEVAITFKDPKDEYNYYEIVITELGSSMDNQETHYQLFSNEGIITSESYYPTQLQLDISKPNYLLFTDREINGQEVTISCFYFPPQVFGTVKYIDNHGIHVHLRNVSEEYFRFKTSMLQHLNFKQEDFFHGASEPVNVYSNVENGFGMFAGFNYSIETLMIDSVIY